VSLASLLDLQPDGCHYSLAIFQTIVTRFFQDSLYFTEAPMRNIAALPSAKAKKPITVQNNV
jgi:hypothetical protein